MLVWRALGRGLMQAWRSLLPIIVILLFFQWLVIGRLPPDWPPILLGVGLLTLGIALFLQGLHYSIFPLGRSLARSFAMRGARKQLLFFAFCLGFAAMIAHPGLMNMATQAAQASQGQIQPWPLRLLVALAVGLVLMLGMLRIVLGHNILWYLLLGYALVIAVTMLAPQQLLALAFDAGGLVVNIVSAPLIAALGVNLASALAGRHPLTDGFGLLALVVMAPMLVLQLYGWLVMPPEPEAWVALPIEPVSVQVSAWQQLWFSLLGLLPIVAVVLVFQFLVLRAPLPRSGMMLFGLLLLLLGLFALLLGLQLSLFPLGLWLAQQLLLKDSWLWLYVLAFSMGITVTMAEPALRAVGEQAKRVAPRHFNVLLLRLLVALGVALGLTLGVHRLLQGQSLQLYLLYSYLGLLLLTLVSPRKVIALAFDLGGVTTSEVTLPLIIALGLSLAAALPGRSLLMDGFGLIALSSLFPIVILLLYALLGRLWHLLVPEK